jgi:hypothetical protein
MLIAIISLSISLAISFALNVILYRSNKYFREHYYNDEKEISILKNEIKDLISRKNELERKVEFLTPAEPKPVEGVKEVPSTLKAGAYVRYKDIRHKNKEVAGWLMENG